MTETAWDAQMDWDLAAFRIDLTLDEVMTDLDPRWDTWSSLEEVAA